MSYVEKAFYWYLRRMLTSGFKMLFSRKYLPYTLFFIVITTATSFISYFANNANIDIALKYYQELLVIEVAIGLGYIITGFLLGKQDALIQFVAIGIISVVSFFILKFAPENVPEILATASYIVWIGISVFASFSMFRDIFGNKVLGTALFLGKPSGQGSILFAGPVFLVLVGDLGLIYYSLINGEALTRGSRLALLLFGIATLVGLLIILFLGGKDDVFFTTLLFVLAFGTIRLLLLFMDVMTGPSKDAISFTDTLLVLFFLIYSVQGMTKKASKLVDEEEEGEEKGDELVAEGSWFAERLVHWTGERGAVIILLGLIFGFHVTQLQVLFGEPILLTQFLSDREITIAELGHELGVIITAGWFFLLILFYIVSPGFRSFASPQIQRFGWLPPFEDLVLILESAKSGEIDWKKEVAKFALSTAGAKILSPFKSNKTSTEERAAGFFARLRKKAKKK